MRKNYDSFACFMETITGANTMRLRWRRKSCDRKTEDGELADRGGRKAEEGGLDGKRCVC